MIAGGSGITPMLQIVRDVFKSDEETKIKLLFANQTEQDILLREEIEDFQRQYPTRFSYMYTIDRPGEGMGKLNTITFNANSYIIIVFLILTKQFAISFCLVLT